GKLFPLMLLGPIVLLCGALLVPALRLQRGTIVPFVAPVQARPPRPMPQVDRRILTDEEVGALEALVQRNPDDVESRVKLLEYDWARPEPDLKMARHAHVLWMIENYPRNAVLWTPAGSLNTFQDGGAADQATALWRKQVEANPKDLVILE